MALSWFLHGSFLFSCFFSLKLLVFQYSTLISFRVLSQEKSPFPAFFWPDPPAAWGLPNLKGLLQIQVGDSIPQLEGFWMSQEGDDLEEPKQIQRIQETQQTSNVIFTFFSPIFHDFRPFSQRPKKKRNQQQTYRIKVAACGVQSNTPQTGNSLVSHPFSWRRNQPTTEKPLEKPLVSPPPFGPTVSHHSTLLVPGL